jgi:hypothetical protein
MYKDDQRLGTDLRTVECAAYAAPFTVLAMLPALSSNVDVPIGAVAAVPNTEAQRKNRVF